jgi:transposase
MFMVCILVGEIREFYKYKIQDIDKFVAELQPDDIIVVESPGNTNYFVNKIKDKVKKVVIVNPARFKQISQSTKKTDKNDAELLALYVQSNVLLLEESRMTDEYSSQLKSMTSTRDKLVKSRTVLKNKIHGILNYHGILSKKKDFTSNKGLNRVLENELSEAVKFELEIIIDEIRHLSENIAKLEAKITDMGSKVKGFENLTSIKGIGDKSATILLSIIGNINDFEDDKKLAAYFGLVPTVKQSNKTIHEGRITKHGSKLGRTTLVLCALTAIKYSPYLKGFYERIQKRRGSGKAIIATARKLLSIIYNTLKNNWVFEDFPNFVLRKG